MKAGALLTLGLIAITSLHDFAEDTTTNADKLLADHDKIMAKMDTMIFKKIELKEGTLEEAAQLLTRESKKADPEHQGVNFVLHATPDDSYRRITLSLGNVSLRDVLKQMFAYDVGDSAIYVWHDNGEGLSKRSFTVPDGFFQTKQGESSELPYDVKPQLEAKGILFPPGRSAVYRSSQRQLIVIEDWEQMEEIDYLLFIARHDKR